MESIRQTPKPQMEPVLVEIAADGFVKVFGSKNINALVFNRPKASTPQNGILVDELIDQILPWTFKKIYFSGMIRRTGLFRPITPAEIQDALSTAYLFASVDTKDKSVNHRSVILSALGGGR